MRWWGAVAALLLAAAAGCRPAAAPAADRPLLGLAEPTATAADTVAVHVGPRRLELRCDRPERLRLGDSERRALITAGDAWWRLPLEPRQGDTLALTAAAVAPAGRPAGLVEAVVELRPGGGASAGDGGRELLRLALAPAEGWVERRLELPAGLAGSGELVLRAEGPGAVAWSELYLLRGAAAEDAELPPSIVLVSLDTVRADHLSLYGYPRQTSPRLDAFAADAWVFSNSYAVSTWTLPSHASLFTGLLPDQHGLARPADRLTESVPTLAEALRRAGYRTAAITDGGFLDPHWGFGRGFERYDVSPGQPWEPKDAAAVVAEAARWIEDNRFRPFFLFVHLYEAHQPYVNREGFADPFLDPAYDGPFGDRVAVFGDRPPITVDDMPRLVALYDGGIRRADHYLGELLELMRRRGLLGSTAVIVTSDHGEELREHGDLEHGLGKVFEENLRVPLVVRPPGGLPPEAARRPATPVTGLDVYATVLDFAGLLPPEGGVLGRSLLAVAAAPADRERTVLVQGINSLQDLDERRYRLDRGNRSLVLDRRRALAVRFDRQRDPGMQRPLPAVAADGAGAGLELRLATALAWLSPAGFAVRLPAGARGVRLPAGEGLEPHGLWSGLSWLDAAPGPPPSLDPGRPGFLVFDLGAGPASRQLAVVAGDRGETVTLRLSGPVAGELFNPLEDDPPEPGRIIATAASYGAEHAAIDAERAQELRALGYLQ